jgi:hypothetical protein
MNGRLRFRTLMANSSKDFLFVMPSRMSLTKLFGRFASNLMEKGGAPQKGIRDADYNSFSGFCIILMTVKLINFRILQFLEPTREAERRNRCVNGRQKLKVQRDVRHARRETREGRCTWSRREKDAVSGMLSVSQQMSVLPTIRTF